MTDFDNYMQCEDHPYCTQPAGHEEDPELLAILMDNEEEEK